MKPYYEDEKAGIVIYHGADSDIMPLCENQNQGQNVDTNKAPNTSVSVYDEGSGITLGRAMILQSEQGEAALSVDIETLGHALNVEQQGRSDITETKTPQITNPPTLSSFAADATCSKTGGWKSSASSPSPICLPREIEQQNAEKQKHSALKDIPTQELIFTSTLEAQELAANALTTTSEKKERQWPPSGIKWYYSDEYSAIALADCRNILPLLEPVDLVLTDPPYNVGLNYSKGDRRVDYIEWINNILATLRQKSPLVLISPGIRNLWIYPPADWVFCWAKPGSTRRSDIGGFNEWEPFLLYGKKKVYHDLNYLPSVSNLSRGKSDHPCPKPIRLFKSYIGSFLDQSGVVLDPFLGSGTTLRAAKDLGLKAIGIEICEAYCEIAAKRLSQDVLPFFADTAHEEVLPIY